MSDPITIHVNAGHGEYLLPNTHGVSETLVWDPLGGDEILTPEDVPQALADAVNDPDIFWDWENVTRIEGTHADITAALHALIRTLDHTPSGDDDVFDYWPSGVRYALNIDKALNGPCTTLIHDMARRVAATTSFAQELLDKIGLDTPAPAGVIAYEAQCGRCGETFNPTGPDDLEHIETTAGEPCGGHGKGLATWGSAPTTPTPTPLPGDVTDESVQAELRGDVDPIGDLEHCLRHGPEAWMVVYDWTRALQVRFPDLAPAQAFHVAVIFYFG